MVASKIKLRILAISMAVLTPSLSEALTISQAYELATQNDPILKAAHERHLATFDDSDVAFSRLMPQINFTGFTHKKEVDNRTQQDKEEYNVHGWIATLEQPVFDLTKWFTWKSSQSRIAQSLATFEQEQQSLILRTAVAYLDVLRIQDNLLTDKALELSLKKQYEQANARYEVGLESKTDSLEALAEYDAAIVERMDSEIELTDARQQLMKIIGVPLDTSLARLKKGFTPETPQPEDQQAWVDFSLANNKQLKARQQAVKIAQQELSASKSTFAPTVNFIAEFKREMDNDTSALGINNRDMEETIYKLRANVPIFLGGSRFATNNKNLKLLTASELDLDDARLSVLRDSRSLYNRTVTDVRRIQARRRGIESALSAFEASTEGYDVGTRTIVDVLDSQRSVFSAIRDYDTARYQYLVNMLKLKQTAGTLSPEDILTLEEATSVTAEPTVKRYLKDIKGIDASDFDL